MGRKYKRKTLDKKAPRSAFKPGDPRINRKGRVPIDQGGTPNKITVGLKEALERAFENVGGQSYLEKVAKRDMRTFISILKALLPTKLAGHDGGPLDADMARIKAGLTNLSDKELAAFQDLMKKILGAPAK